MFNVLPLRSVHECTRVQLARVRERRRRSCDALLLRRMHARTQVQLVTLYVRVAPAGQ